MYRYTTPSVVFTLPFEASTVTEAYISITQREITLEKDLSSCTVEDKKLKCELSQAETGSLSKGTAQIQLRCKCDDGKAYASQIAKIQVLDVLKDGEI